MRDFTHHERARRRVSLTHLFVIVGVLLTFGGTATAASLITSTNIKDNTIQSRDIKNGSLLLKDFSAAERGKLKGATGAAGAAGATGATGAAGANGTNGAPGAVGPRGASAFEAPPSGSMISGGGRLNVETSGPNVDLSSYSSIPFTTTAPIVDFGEGRNIWFGSPGLAEGDAEIDDVKCAGTAESPDPTAGNLCVYLSESEGISDGSAWLWSGATPGADTAESNGFYVTVISGDATAVNLSYVWAYKAP